MKEQCIDILMNRVFLKGKFNNNNCIFVIPVILTSIFSITACKPDCASALTDQTFSKCVFMRIAVYIMWVLDIHNEKQCILQLLGNCQSF